MKDMKMTDAMQEQRVRVFVRGIERGTLTYAGLGRCNYQPSRYQMDRQRLTVGDGWLADFQDDPDWSR